MTDNLPPIQLEKGVVLHLHETCALLYEVALSNIRYQQDTGLGVLAKRIQEARTNVGDTLAHDVNPARELTQICDAIDMLHILMSHRTIPKDSMVRVRLVLNILDIVDIGNRSAIKRSGTNTSIDPIAFRNSLQKLANKYGADFDFLHSIAIDPNTHDVSLHHLVTTHGKDLLDLAEEITKTLPLTHISRAECLDSIRSLRSGGILRSRGG